MMSTPNTPASNRLDGRVALVTGAARGIGAAIGRAFAVEGAAVALVDLLDEEYNVPWTPITPENVDALLEEREALTTR